MEDLAARSTSTLALHARESQLPTLLPLEKQVYVWLVYVIPFVCLTTTVSCYVAQADLKYASVSLPSAGLELCTPHMPILRCSFTRLDANTDRFNQATVCSKYIKHIF